MLSNRIKRNPAEQTLTNFLTAINIMTSTSQTQQTALHTFGHNVGVPLRSEFVQTLYETSHGNLVSVPPYRPNSVQSIQQYSGDSILPTNIGYGKMNKSRYIILLFLLLYQRCSLFLLHFKASEIFSCATS